MQEGGILKPSDKGTIVSYTFQKLLCLTYFESSFPDTFIAISTSSASVEGVADPVLIFVKSTMCTILLFACVYDILLELNK